MNKLLKNYGRTIISTNIIIFIPLIIGLILWNKLPNQLPMHYNTYGEIDSYSDKLFGLLFGPIFTFSIYWILLVIIHLDSKKSNKENNLLENRKVMTLLLLIMPCLSLYIGYLVYGDTLGISVNVNTISLLALGLIFILIGNYLPKSKPNSVFGLRLSWTMDNTDVWTKSNRFSGILFIVLGFLMIINSFIHLGDGIGSFILTVCGSLVIMLLSIIYSFIISK